MSMMDVGVCQDCSSISPKVMPSVASEAANICHASFKIFALSNFLKTRFIFPNLCSLSFSHYSLGFKFLLEIDRGAHA